MVVRVRVGMGMGVQPVLAMLSLVPKRADACQGEGAADAEHQEP